MSAALLLLGVVTGPFELVPVVEHVEDAVELHLRRVAEVVGAARVGSPNAPSARAHMVSEEPCTRYRRSGNLTPSEIITTNLLDLFT